MERLSRATFVKVAGAATGAAALAAAPKAWVAVSEESAEKTGPMTDAPADAIVAYVRYPERGEYTVRIGTTERTYRDRALVDKLLRAAGKAERV